ncbi:MAG: nucleotidyltransferase domain-containing protein [Clostridia bacterium]|nr:nucleotidyltransferase domain-containing protein [Clostridia bacterium]
MYDTKDREKILNQLVMSLQSREDILSVILVGSGAIGFKDKYSDLDLSIVTNDSDIETIFTKTYQDMQQICQIAAYEAIPRRKLQVFLLDNYLEIDIGYCTLDALYAKRENFKVIYDKTGKAEKQMVNSWHDLQLKNKGTTDVVDMHKVIRIIDEKLWYNFMHSIIAYKRNDKYRCYYELNEIRTAVIDLIAKRNEVDSKRYKQMYLLPIEEQMRIDKMFFYPQSYDELATLLFYMLDHISTELEYWKSTEGISYTFATDFLKNFITENMDEKNAAIKPRISVDKNTGKR